MLCLKFRGSLCWLLTLIASSASAALATTDDVFIVLGHGKAMPAHVPEQVRGAQSEEFRRAVEETVEQFAPWAEKVRSEMASKGYVTTSTEMVNFAIDPYVDSKRLVALPRLDSRMSFEPKPLPSLAEAEFLGYVAESAEGPRTVVRRVYDHAELGVMVIRELDFKSRAGFMMIEKPRGDVFIGPYPASYTVLRSEDGSEGSTSLQFLTNRMLYSVNVSQAIERDDPRHLTLVSMVHDLL